MILDLTELRQDYKSIYRSNWPLATKINTLIEVAKIEVKFQTHTCGRGKFKAALLILEAAGQSVGGLICAHNNTVQTVHGKGGGLLLVPCTRLTRS